MYLIRLLRLTYLMSLTYSHLIRAGHGYTEEGPIMTDAVIPHPFKLDKEAQEVTARMRAIESVFASNGLTTHLTDARAGLDLSAVLSPSGKREAEIWVDENGYVEVRYWSPEGSSAEQIATVALPALLAVTGATPADFAQRAAV